MPSTWAQRTTLAAAPNARLRIGNPVYLDNDGLAINIENAPEPLTYVGIALTNTLSAGHVTTIEVALVDEL